MKEYDVISNISGCGAKLIPRVIAEIGDVRRFKNEGSIEVMKSIKSNSKCENELRTYSFLD